MTNFWIIFQVINIAILAIAGKVTNKLSTLVSVKMAKQSEAKSAERSFASIASKIKNSGNFDVKPVLAKFNWANNWSFYPQRVSEKKWQFIGHF